MSGRASARAVVPRPAGDRARRLDLPRRDGLQHPRQPAVPRSRHRQVLPPGALRGVGPVGDGDAAAGRVRGDGEHVRDGLAPRCGASSADAAHGQQAGPLPAGPALPAPDGAPAGRADRRGVQPRGHPGAGRVARRPVLLRPGDSADEGGGGGPPARAGARDRHRAGRPRPLHAGALDGAVHGPRRPGDQHPPLVPAELQGRAAVRPGPRAGVKLIGASAHHVTADLDEGPTIEQDVARADHTHTAEQLARAGRTSRRGCWPVRSCGTPSAGCC